MTSTSAYIVTLIGIYHSLLSGAMTPTREAGDP